VTPTSPSKLFLPQRRSTRRVQSRAVQASPSRSSWNSTFLFTLFLPLKVSWRPYSAGSICWKPRKFRIKLSERMAGDEKTPLLRASDGVTPCGNEDRSGEYHTLVDPFCHFGIKLDGIQQEYACSKKIMRKNQLHLIYDDGPVPLAGPQHCNGRNWKDASTILKPSRWKRAGAAVFASVFLVFAWKMGWLRTSLLVALWGEFGGGLGNNETSIYEYTG
jgi:hypothetical protein